MGEMENGNQEAALDLASRLTQDHHQSLKLWLRMLSCTVRIENEIRSRMRATFDITLPRFDLMAQLERKPDGLKMNELSRRMMVTGGNVTGITDQLAAEGLVERALVAGDRRAYRVRLTPLGRQQFEAMARQHEGWIVAAFEGLSPNEVEALHQLLGKVKQHFNNSPLETA